VLSLLYVLHDDEGHGRLLVMSCWGHGELSVLTLGSMRKTEGNHMGYHFVCTGLHLLTCWRLLISQRNCFEINTWSVPAYGRETAI